MRHRRSTAIHLERRLKNASILAVSRCRRCRPLAHNAASACDRYASRGKRTDQVRSSQSCNATLSPAARPTFPSPARTGALLRIGLARSARHERLPGPVLLESSKRAPFQKTARPSLPPPSPPEVLALSLWTSLRQAQAPGFPPMDGGSACAPAAERHSRWLVTQFEV